MGTSTVSGPFRSENGFQELVNGEWVPVASGGGIQTVIALPDQTTALNFTEPGQSIIVAGLSPDVATYTIDVAPLAGVDIWVVDGGVIQYSISGLTTTYLGNNFPIVCGNFYFTFTFVDIRPGTYGLITGKIVVTGWYSTL
jgi:hypothetical protein